MLGAFFQEYIIVFSEKWRKSNYFLFIDRFLNFGGFYYGPLFLYFVYRSNITYIGEGIFLD